MALILDTNALSAFADGDDAFRCRIQDELDFELPVIALGEFLYGIRQSRYRAQYETWLRSNLAIFALLTVGPQTASAYAEIRSELKKAGQPVPSNDLWIAALCREHGRRLLTRDGHFRVVTGLQIVNW